MELRGTRWKRYGKDRTYYVDELGERVGWVDNLTGEITEERPGGSDLLCTWIMGSGERVESDLPESTSVEPARPASPAPERAPELVDERAPAPTADVDLAGNVAGAAARQRAEAEYAQRKEDVGRFWAWAGKTLDVHTDERAWRVGANAEETVGEELERLAKHGWRILHSVPVGQHDSDIDHVLIGPGGVVTVNTKHHPNARVWVVAKQVRVNNQPVPYLPNSRFEAARASKLLSARAGIPVPAIGCLVFRLGNGTLTIKEDPGDVLVYRATKAYKALRAMTGVLSPAEVEQVYEAARWGSTWTHT